MLKLQYKDQRKAAIWLVDSRYAIGRDASNDIVLDEEGVSGFHAELRVEDDDRVFLTDAGSINGTYVNGKQIKARTQLRAKDVIRINNIELELVDPKDQLAAHDASDSATAMTPALQGLNVSQGSSSGSGGGVGGVPTGWKLRAKTGTLAGQALDIPASGRAVLGRSTGCDIVLAGTHVSRQHAELYFQSGKLHVKDLGSSNGTFLNRKKIQESIVKPGDELRFDTLVFIVESPDSAVEEEEEDSNKTSFRAAVQIPDSKPEAKPAPKPAAPKPAQPAAAKPAPAKPAAQPAPPPEPPSSGGGMGLVIVLVLVVAAVAGGVFFMM